MIRRSKKEVKEKTDHTRPHEHSGTDIPVNDGSLTDSEAGNENQDSGTSVSGQDNAYTELNDKYLRLYSDFDNYRKRTLKERAELSKFASSDLIVRLLPVIDDFDRAIRAFDSGSEAGQALKDGVVLIYNKFMAVLQQQGLQAMRSSGETFDTDFHEAITNIPVPDPGQKGRIVDEIEKGYLLHGKVIRYAKVVVGS